MTNKMAAIYKLVLKAVHLVDTDNEICIKHDYNMLFTRYFQ